MAEEVDESIFHWERSFAVNMARLRAAQGMSQNEFARRITSRGLPFYQATVQRIESRERSVRLDEARLISEELGVPLERMIRDESGSYGDLLDLTHASQALLASIGNSVSRHRIELESLMEVLRIFLKEVPDPQNEDQTQDLEKAQALFKRMQKVERQMTTVTNSVQPDIVAIRARARRGSLGKGIGALIPPLKDGQRPVDVFFPEGERGGSDGEHSETP